MLLRDAACGCAFLHTHEPCIVHLDLKSVNLLVDHNWNLKVADFGMVTTKRHFYVNTEGGGAGGGAHGDVGASVDCSRSAAW